MVSGGTDGGVDGVFFCHVVVVVVSFVAFFWLLLVMVVVTFLSWLCDWWRSWW